MHVPVFVPLFSRLLEVPPNLFRDLTSVGIPRTILVSRRVTSAAHSTRVSKKSSSFAAGTLRGGNVNHNFEEVGSEDEGRSTRLPDSTLAFWKSPSPIWATWHDTSFHRTPGWRTLIAELVTIELLSCLTRRNVEPGPVVSHLQDRLIAVIVSIGHVRVILHEGIARRHADADDVPLTNQVPHLESIRGDGDSGFPAGGRRGDGDTVNLPAFQRRGPR